ncbi:MAG: D-inositol 3-phosphate glycosyltransferase [candidate division BRC1 bacterium ADurb.BinA364]|nr:MAG: D-inositol 3-phosphate glycosyltransferase [candidate division BRC1 bacterium ADurb.BinA364]
MNAPARRVAHVLSVASYAGPSRVAANMLAEFGRRGWKTALVLLERPGASLERLKAEARAAGAELFAIAAPGKLNPLAPFRLRRLVRRQEFDIVHAHGYKPDLYAWLARARRDPWALATTAHGWMPVNRRLSAYEALDRRLLRAFDRVFAVSPPLLESVMQCGVRRDRAVLAPNAVDFRSIRWPSAEDSARLRREWGVAQGDILAGVLGRLSPEKGQDRLLRALARLGREYRAVFVGDGRARDGLIRLAEELGVRDRVVFAGETAQPLAALAAFDIAAFPSRSEGAPQALLEAMAMGRPIAAAAVGGMPNALGALEDGAEPCGLLLSNLDPDALARSIERLAPGRAEARQMGAAAARRVRERFSLERLGDLTEAHYRAAIRERRGTSGL